MSARKREQSKSVCPVSLLILEGETEEVFYPLIRDRYLKGVQYQSKCIKGLGQTNRQIINTAITFCLNNPNNLVRIYCCIDTERGKKGVVPFEIDYVRDQIATLDRTRIVNNLGYRKTNQIKRQILSISAIQADPDIESWFFYDIKGIYEFLQAPKAKRNVKKYANPPLLGKYDLKSVFNQFDKQKPYREGKRARHFIQSLNLETIIAGCKELREGIELINAQAKDLTNHISK